MRTIKFRAWDKKENRMCLEALEICNIGLGQGSVVVTEDVQSGNELIWMQFTGLLDKNGKEIYEGDLFRCIYHSDGHNDHIYEVVYSEEMTAFILKRIGKQCPQIQVRQNVRDVARYEVIGNIYENPELIK